MISVLSALPRVTVALLLVGNTASIASAASRAGANCFCSSCRRLLLSELLSGCVFAGGCSFCQADWYAAFRRRALSPRARTCTLGAGSQPVRASPRGGSSLMSSVMSPFYATPPPRRQGSLRCSVNTPDAPVPAKRRWCSCPNTRHRECDVAWRRSFAMRAARVAHSRRECFFAGYSDSKEQVQASRKITCPNTYVLCPSCLMHW